jgi:hypothetical protein
MLQARWTRRRSALLSAGIVLALAGCGTASQSPSSPGRGVGAGHDVGAGQIPQVRPITGRRTAASPQLLLEVNTVCRAVRQGAPRALKAPYTPATVQRYATSAEVPARRTIISLQRLSARGGASALQAIAGGYGQLQAVYSSAGFAARSARGARQLGQTIQVREQFISAVARSNGAPACGVAGR